MKKNVFQHDLVNLKTSNLTAQAPQCQAANVIPLGDIMINKVIQNAFESHNWKIL